MAAGVKPDVWTRVQFKSLTGGNKTRKALAEIDRLLLEWDGIKNGLSSQQRVRKLRELLDACVAYLAAKEAKKTKKENAKFGKPSALLTARITQVKQLVGQIFSRLAFEQHQYQKTTRSGQPNSALGAARANLRGLQGSYAHERSNFTDIKQANNLAGTQTHINAPGGTFVHQKLDEYAADAAKLAGLPGNIQAIVGRGFDNLTLQEFNTLQAHFSQGQQGLGGLPKVHYARKDERLRALMLVPYDGKLYKSDGTLEGAAGNKWRGWALDSYGNILVARGNATWNDGAAGAQFNHSTLNAGRDVICAGDMQIDMGMIKYISNGSGHYKPTAASLARALWVLLEEYNLQVTLIDEVEDVVSGNKYTNPGAIIAFMAPHMP